jgi:hypothetical protein
MNLTVTPVNVIVEPKYSRPWTYMALPINTYQVGTKYLVGAVGGIIRTRAGNSHGSLGP